MVMNGSFSLAGGGAVGRSGDGVSRSNDAMGRYNDGVFRPNAAMFRNDEVLRAGALPKGTLAALYFPKSSPETAVRHLMRWVELCRPLSEALSALGYRKSQKVLTVKQVAAIYEFLGEP
jgi:hypothetical protein